MRAFYRVRPRNKVNTEMKKCKLSLIALLSVIIVALLSISFTAFAADDENYRSVALDGSNVFYTSVNGAEVTSYKVTTGTGDDEKTTYYALFTAGVKAADAENDDGDLESDVVSFRKNLAYEWYEGFNEIKTFSMTFAFPKADFKKYIITFQSQQYANTEDKISENFLIFTPAEGGVKMYITDDKDKLPEDGKTFALGEKIKIDFARFVNGDYEIYANNSLAGNFKNVTEACAKYVSTGDNAVTPMIFSAVFDKDAAEGVNAQLVLYELNGQSFELTNVKETDGKLSSGEIKDDKAPVLCMNKTLNYLEFGGDFSGVDFTVIDVVASSPRSTVNYYVLTTEQYLSDMDYDAYENPSSGDNGGADTPAPDNPDGDGEVSEPEEWKSPFREVTSGEAVRLLRDSGTFVLPESITGDDDKAELKETDGYKTYGLVKAFVKITDVTGSRGQSDYVYLDWYVPAEYKVNIYDRDLKNDDNKYCGFIRIAEDLQGATYADDDTATGAKTYEKRIEEIERLYQEKIDEAIASLEYDEKDGLENGKLYAGSDRYFYLPDFSEFISENIGGYTDLKFDIYSWSDSKSADTSLSSSQLKIRLNASDTEYMFTIYVKDAAGNPMRYPVFENGILKTDDNGAPVYETLDGVDRDTVWNDEYKGLLPFFRFNVSYRPATVDEPEEQSVAYIDSTYSSASFKINGVNGMYKTAYNMYVFDREAMYDDWGLLLSYEDFIKNTSALFLNEFTYDFGGERGKVTLTDTRKYFDRVTPSGELNESDENYERDSKYDWNSSSVTFKPQSTSEFYVIRLSLDDLRTNKRTESFMAIRASVKPNSLPGEDDWVENNVVSIVLLTIAGVCFVGLVVLLVVKPKDKDDMDVVAEETAAKKNKRNKKNSD